ncbi:GNAT family N-acetyltransferase [Arthrobacter echini]|uniref:GNAT family N-acetyltransferase n=1 Tax=Arthrobacter echini TaxID=1529066 RepID=A0A4S5E2Y0_9MICC|nr:GNAT family protein [Arthrobacter echini]THJ65766.1 GNAT family N-acetyltransferase [Arthrobacter echini]
MTLELRPWTPDDAPALLSAYRENPDLATQFAGTELASVEDAQKYVAGHLAALPSRRTWALNVDGAVVGNVGLSNVERDHGTAWAYYWLVSAARGNGYAARALGAAAGWAFDDGLFRLELGHRVNNPASCRVATRAGFVPEGIERGKLRYGSQRFDVETHARLRTDPAPDLDAASIVG